MRLLSHIIALSVFSAAAIAVPLGKRASYIQGIDYVNYQLPVDWAAAASQGVAFAYIQATQGITTRDQFATNYAAAAKNGIIHGAINYADPSASTGSSQATFFFKNGGAWTRDGATLPGAIQLEGGCSRFNETQMVAWIKDYSDTYHSNTARYPVIFTSTGWWSYCTGGSTAFASTNPLWVANWATDMGPLPAGWSAATFGQTNNLGSFGNQDYFLTGDATALRNFASG